MDDTVVDQLWKEFAEVGGMLRLTEDISLRIRMDDTFRKMLLLTAASHFETQLQRAVESFIEKETNHNQLIVGLVRMKVIKQQYHTWFDWNASNANKFFSLFGTDFRTYMQERIASGNPREAAVRAFIEIGVSRNSLVHDNFGNFRMEKTMEEIYALYQDAREFVDLFPSPFYEYVERNKAR